MKWPIEIADVEAAAARLAPHLKPTALRSYAPLDAEVGGGIRLFVKHKNHQPTQSFKVRNALSMMTRLDEAARRRRVDQAGAAPPRLCGDFLGWFCSRCW